MTLGANDYAAANFTFEYPDIHLLPNIFELYMDYGLGQMCQLDLHGNVFSDEGVGERQTYGV